MERHSLIREGIITGLLGAAGVALWFLIIDVLHGAPLLTPATLGEGLLSMFGAPRISDGMALYVTLYTIAHVVAFIVLGIIATAVVHASAREPAVLAGALILFVVMQVLFYGFSAMMSQRELLGSLAWYQVGAANLVAAILMVTYLWRTHPALGAQLRHSLSGEE